jgi:hypothetical protein
MEHKNINLFFSFLRDALLHPESLDSKPTREAWVKDLEHDTASNGSCCFEVPSTATKDYTPALYYFRREFFVDSDGDWNYRILHGETERRVRVSVDRTIAPAFWVKVDVESENGNIVAEFLATGGSSSCEVSVADVAMMYAKSLPEWEDGAVKVG